MIVSESNAAAKNMRSLQFFSPLSAIIKQIDNNIENRETKIGYKTRAPTRNRTSIWRLGTNRICVITINLRNFFPVVRQSLTISHF